MWQRFTERARRVILLGQEEAGKMQTGHVGTEHLLLGLVRENEGVAAQVLQKMGIALEKVRQEVEAQAVPDGSPPPGPGGEPKLTPKAKRVLELAADEARRMRHNYIGTEHLLLALLREKDGLAAIVLRKMGLNLDKARTQVMEYLGPNAPGEKAGVGGSASGSGEKSRTGRSQTPALDQFGRDINQLALDGQLDPVIGRGAQIDRAIQILCRRTKNNPVLVGEPGVGKTAIRRCSAIHVTSPRLHARASSTP
jgi:ATP-dependent Clp protease ATP-binding subunit ClpC